ncbi:MAG: hypothetical protein OEV42_02330 [Deltaproteobacteria bacterium]|nr:hypothetical protein [Deltaproteobacteria bacterium]
MNMKKRKKTITTLLCLVTLFYSSPGLAGSNPENWTGAATTIEKALKGALTTFREGKSEEATEMVADAYFAIFESEKANMEIAVRRFISFKVAIKIEKNFNKLRKAMHGKEDIKDIEARTATLIADVKEAALKLDRKGVGMNMKFNR